MANKTCSIAECEDPSCARGWCNRHYLRWKKHGDPEKLVQAPPGHGSTDERGYRRVFIDGRLQFEHRIVAEEHLGRPLLPEEVVHHEGAKDDNRWEMLKVFPNQAAHMAYHVSFATHCSNGHEWTEENTIETKGRRYCRACKRDRGREYMRRKRAKMRNAA